MARHLMTEATLLAPRMKNIQRTLFVDAPPKTVWSQLARWDDASWHPWVEGVEVIREEPAGVGSVRACNFGPYGAQKERLVVFREPEAWSIEIFDIAGPITRARSDWTLEPEGKGTRVTIKVSYEPAPGAPEDQIEAALLEHVRVALDGFAESARAQATPRRA